MPIVTVRVRRYQRPSAAFTRACEIAARMERQWRSKSRRGRFEDASERLNYSEFSAIAIRCEQATG